MDKKLFYFFLVLTLISSCKKKEDDVFGPTISITSPLENQSYNVYDMIHVVATISDETKISTVSACLVDANYEAAHVAVQIPVSSPSMTVNIQYALDNIHLQSGIYYLMISASDGKNNNHVYRKIYINAVPRVVSKVFVVSKLNASQTHLSYIDSSFTGLVAYHSFNGDYLGSSTSNYFQQFTICGNYTGSFTTIELEHNTVKYSLPPLVTSVPFFTAFWNDDMKNYISEYNGIINGYDCNGNIQYGGASKPDYYLTRFCMNGGYLVAEEKDIYSSTKKLITYYPTGVGFQECSVSQDIVCFYEKDPENVFGFGNLSGQGIIQLFNRTQNSLWSPYNYSMPAGSILSAVQIDADTYLIGLSDGNVYKYQFQTSNLTVYLSGYTAVQLKYDTENNEVFVVEANRISTFDYPTKLFHRAVNSSETILDVHLLYNR